MHSGNYRSTLESWGFEENPTGGGHAHWALDFPDYICKLIVHQDAMSEIEEEYFGHVGVTVTLEVLDGEYTTPSIMWTATSWKGLENTIDTAHKIAELVCDSRQWAEIVGVHV
jgi:hypothetical protein